MRSHHHNKHSLRAAPLFFAAFVIALALTLNACSQAKWQEVGDANTGHPEIETQVAPPPIKPLERDQTVFVAPERLRARTNPEQAPEAATTVLDQATPVRIVDANPQGPDQLIAVKEEPPAVSPQQIPVAQAPVVFVPAKYVTTSAPNADQARYILIQNIATEKLRVYLRAVTPGKPNRMIFETDMIAGENNPTKTRRTALGHYRIDSWHKFYEDREHLFPSWFDASYPTLPLPGASLEDWTQSHFLPVVDGKPRGVVRGAFGWYTAKIGPNAYNQWTHGTLGWGADQARFIQLSKDQLTQFYSDPRSFGCTRVENRAIAFLQDLLPIGTPVLKIYAREQLADPKLAAYANEKPLEFEFTLTKDQVRSANPSSSNRPAQILRDVPDSLKLEEGSYLVDQYPDAVEFSKHVKGEKLNADIVRAEANLYDLSKDAFHGVFYVDQGLLEGYAHPKELRVGGFKDSVLPRAVLKD